MAWGRKSNGQRREVLSQFGGTLYVASLQKQRIRTLPNTAGVLIYGVPDCVMVSFSLPTVIVPFRVAILVLASTV
jgi:hypothetical protein